jgi:hypothetical protein
MGTNNLYSVLSSRLFSGPLSLSMAVVILFAIAVLLTCSKMATTFAPCRSCWATKDVKTTMIYTQVPSQSRG